MAETVSGGGAGGITHTGTSGLPQGISRSEFDELKGSVRDLAAALKARADADNAKDKAAAAEDVKEAKADLKTLAKEMGIDPKRLEEAAANAKREERKAELAPLIREILDEEIAGDDDESGAADQDQDKDDEEDDQEKPDDSDSGKHEPEGSLPPDSEPRREHWSERAVSGLLG